MKEQKTKPVNQNPSSEILPESPWSEEAPLPAGVLDSTTDSHADLPEVLIKGLEDFLIVMRAFPDSTVRGLVFDRDAKLGDTAWWNVRDGKVTFTEKLLNNITKHADPGMADKAVRLVLKHEAWHSSYTRFWPENIVASQAFLVNHLEDWRNHNFLLYHYPKDQDAMINLYQIITRSRSVSPEAAKMQEEMKKQMKLASPKEAEEMEIRDDITYIWKAVSERTPYSFHDSSFEFQINYVLDTGKEDPTSGKITAWHPKAVEAIKKCLPHMVKYRSFQPEPYDKWDRDQKSLSAIEEAYKIFKILDPYFNFEKERQLQQSMKSGMTAQEALEEIEKELLSRQQGQGQQGQGQQSQGQQSQGQQGQGQQSQGQQGQGQQGQGQQGQGQQSQGQQSQGQQSQGQQSQFRNSLKGMSNAELEDLKQRIKELQDMPGQGKPGEAKEIGPKEISTERERIEEEKKAEHGASNQDPDQRGGIGYSTGSGIPSTPTNPVDKAAYDQFVLSNLGLIRQLKRKFANAKAKSELERGHRSEAGKIGQRLRIRGVIEHIAHPSENSKIYWERQGDMTKGRRHLVLENMLIGLDCSGSMQNVLGPMRAIVSLICEACKDAKIQTSVVAALDGAPEILATGSMNERRETVIRKIMNVRAEGGTDMGNGALNVLATLRKPTSKKQFSRLIVVTDCCTSTRDLNEVSEYSQKIGYPTMVLGLGTDSENAETVLKHMPNASIICFDKTSASTENIYRYLHELSDWMADPYEYKALHRTPRMLSEFGDRIRLPNPELLNGIDLT